MSRLSVLLIAVIALLGVVRYASANTNTDCNFYNPGGAYNYGCWNVFLPDNITHICGADNKGNNYCQIYPQPGGYTYSQCVSSALANLGNPSSYQYGAPTTAYGCPKGRLSLITGDNGSNGKMTCTADAACADDSGESNNNIHCKQASGQGAGQYCQP